MQRIAWITLPRVIKQILNCVNQKAQPPLPLYPNISLRLHGFAARVMGERDSNKLYLITAPLERMRSLLCKALPGHAHDGDSLAMAHAFLEREGGSGQLQALEATQSSLWEEEGLHRKGFTEAPNEEDAMRAGKALDATRAQLRALEGAIKDAWAPERGHRR